MDQPWPILRACIRGAYSNVQSLPEAALKREALLARIAELEAQKQRLEADPAPNARERQSLLKLVPGMAVAGYTYNPRASRNTATRDIVADLERHQIPAVAQETFLGRLRTAMQELDWPPPDYNGGQ